MPRRFDSVVHDQAVGPVPDGTPAPDSLAPNTTPPIADAPITPPTSAIAPSDDASPDAEPAARNRRPKGE